jgi:antitoxin (DNA-binding transcriptional repressor) of toxin-antitoxin stability system
MKTIAVSEFKTKVSENLKLVEEGEIIIITDHNRSVATVQAIAEPLVEYAAKTPFHAGPVHPSTKSPKLAATLLDAEWEEG